MKKTIFRSIIIFFALVLMLQSFIAASGFNLGNHPVMGIVIGSLVVIATLTLPKIHLMRKYLNNSTENNNK
jgi:hypothetical protein